MRLITLKLFLMMKVLFIRLPTAALCKFIKNQWWIGILVGIFSGLWCFPPNIINFNRVKGVVVNTYAGKDIVHVSGKGSFEFDKYILVLEDSSKYSINLLFKPKIDSLNTIGKEVEIIYDNIGDQNSIGRLKINNHVITTEDNRLVVIFFLSVTWVIWGGFLELIRLWKSV